MALCIAIFDRDDLLLYLKVKDKISEHRDEVQRFLHNSCDIIADRINFPASKSNPEHYLGSLLLSNLFRSHAYLTNTGTKFVIVTDVENNALKDHEIRLFFKKLHLKYCNAMSNPFYAFGSPIKSSQIDAAVKDFFECF